jgi:hypothetical protein
MTKMYEQVVLVRPLHLDFTGAVMKPGAKAVVVDLIDDDVVLLEFDLDAPELVGGKRMESTVATTSDFVPISA